MKRKILFPIIAVFAVILSLVSVCMAESDEQAKVKDAISVMNEIMAIPENAVPPALLRNAEAIAIIPGVIKAGFIIGGRHGSGIVVINDKETGWSNPAFITLTGGSFGWQIGAQSADIILVFKSKRSIDNIMKGKFTLGADAAVAAGPVGRQAEAGTDIKLKSEIYSYSRSRGLFAGLAIEGASLQVDDDANEAFYGERVVHSTDVLKGKRLKAPEIATKLKEALAKYMVDLPPAKSEQPPAKEEKEK